MMTSHDARTAGDHGVIMRARAARRAHRSRGRGDIVRAIIRIRCAAAVRKRSPVRGGGHVRRGAFAPPSIRLRRQHCASSRCQVTAASLLVAERFAGARPDAIKRQGWTRMTAEKKRITAQLLRSRSVVTRADGGAATARTGVKWMLTVGTTTLLERLNKLLVQVSVKRGGGVAAYGAAYGRIMCGDITLASSLSLSLSLAAREDHGKRHDNDGNQPMTMSALIVMTRS